MFWTLVLLIRLVINTHNDFSLFCEVFSISDYLNQHLNRTVPLFTSALNSDEFLVHTEF